MVVTAGNATGAVIWMRACSATAAVSGVLLGCALGALAATQGIKLSKQPTFSQWFWRDGVWFVFGAGFLMFLYLSHFEVTWLPHWVMFLGEFFVGGAWLAFVSAPFTLGVCILFHSWGAGKMTSDHSAPLDPTDSL
jgi:hypothetical protein